VDPLSTVESIPSLETMRASISRALAIGQAERWSIAEVGEAVAGYGRVASWVERDGTWVYLTLGWVAPEWRGRGIGTAMIHQSESQIRRWAPADHPGEAAEFAANASSTEMDATDLLLHEGYHTAYKLLEMTLDPWLPLPDPPPALPSSIAIRAVAPDHMMPIALSVSEAYESEYADGRYDSGATPADFADELRQERQDPTLWQVAWSGAGVVGQVLSVIERDRAEVFEVSVRPAWRRRGLGRALLARALREIRRRGVDEIRLHTRDDFPTHAKDLYASLGFRVLKEFPRYRKPLQSAHRPAI
jgi:ribosomal protein S18 acetylase RimI-like enzyme